MPDSTTAASTARERVVRKGWTMKREERRDGEKVYPVRGTSKGFELVQRMRARMAR